MRYLATHRLLFLLLPLAAWLAGCASQVPTPIREPAPGGISPNETRQQPERFIGQTVRWGGRIIQIQNLPQQTQLIVLAARLDSEGEPLQSASVQGRFIAIIGGFLEPSLYSPGRDITVRGILVETVTENVGEYPYTYPVVDVRYHYLWPMAEKYDDEWYTPWHPWDPWYPWHFYPYGPHRYFW